MQKLFAIFIALAVLFAPQLSRAGEAVAAVPDHHMQMMDGGHCQMPSSDSGDQDASPGKECCISMCMAVAITPPVPLSHEEVRSAPAVSTARTFLVGVPAETATPPPRSA